MIPPTVFLDEQPCSKKYRETAVFVSIKDAVKGFCVQHVVTRLGRRRSSVLPYNEIHFKSGRRGKGAQSAERKRNTLRYGKLHMVSTPLP